MVMLHPKIRSQSSLVQYKWEGVVIVNTNHICHGTASLPLQFLKTQISSLNGFLGRSCGTPLRDCSNCAGHRRGTQAQVGLCFYHWVDLLLSWLSFPWTPPGTV